MQNTASNPLVSFGRVVSAEDILVDTLFAMCPSATYNAETGIATLHGTEINIRAYASRLDALPADAPSYAITDELWALIETALAN